MTKRRTSGIQRRSRASEAAMTRRAVAGGSGATIDTRLLILLGILVVGGIVLVVILLFGGGTATRVGERQVDDGGGHIADGTVGGPYSSVPATSGPHWGSTAEWGVYTDASPAIQSQVIHNLEHGGIVIWYQPTQLDAASVQALADYVRQQVRTAKYKVLLSPWTGEDFDHPIAVTSWNWLLYQDELDLDQVRAYLDDHYQEAPEPNGGPGPPAG
jgi:hypothetical protein